MDRKLINKINKVYDGLYDLESQYMLFKVELNRIEAHMKKEGYKATINRYDKCVFVKEVLK